MTAEIVIMNNQGIALAADSAVTMGKGENQKIFPSASKIFSLSKYHPVGIMFYGNADFMGIPWETTIKMYRAQLAERHYPSLQMYADDFLSFLVTAPTVSNEKTQEGYVATAVMIFFSFLYQEIAKEVNSALCKGPPLTDTGVKRLISRVIKRHYDDLVKLSALDKSPSDYKHSIRTKYFKLIQECKEDIFEKVPLSQATSRIISNMAIDYFVKAPIEHEGLSGLVITGFGEDEAVPSLMHFSIDGIAAGVLRYVYHSTETLHPGMEASITPFAQSEMVVRFMDGVDPLYENTAKKYIAKILHQYPQEIIDSIDTLTHDEKRVLKARLADKARKEFQDIEKGLTRAGCKTS